MPPNQKCPACGTMVLDWHREWHSIQDQRSIFEGKAAIECPFCKGGIAYDQFLQLTSAAGSERVVAKRDIMKAAEWARVCDGKSLREYVLTLPGSAFSDAWTAAQIQAADANVGSRVE
jgi:hypothetical protein